jgi:hypothetical protein
VRFIRAVKTLAGLLAIIFIGLAVTLFVCFPRVVNALADTFGTGAEEVSHWIPAIVIDLLLVIIAYFWVWRPWRRFTYAQEAQGLVVYRGQGRAYMDTESVRQQVYAAVAKIPDVQRAEVTINNDLGRASIQVNVLTGNDIHGPKKKQEISREIKKVVQDQLGIQLAGEPMINISLTPIAGEVPHATPATPPLVSKSPSSPRTTSEPVRSTSEPARRPVMTPTRSEPTPPVESPRTEPVEIRTSEPVMSEPPPAEESTTVPSDTGTSSDSPVIGSRPFARRPFVPPGGSSTLPDLPPRPETAPDREPEQPSEQPSEQVSEQRSDEPSMSALAGEESPSETMSDGEKSDSMRENQE